MSKGQMKTPFTEAQPTPAMGGAIGTYKVDGPFDDIGGLTIGIGVKNSPGNALLEGIGKKK